MDRLAAVLTRRGRGRAGATEAAPVKEPAALLESLRAGERPDYCLYLGPTRMSPAGGAAVGAAPDLAFDAESLFVRAFAPLPLVPLDGHVSPLRRLPSEGPAADEAFDTLAGHARVLLAVPSDRPPAVARLRRLRDGGHLWRTVCFMPDMGTFGEPDWAAAWQAARDAASPAGIALPPYTAGGWLFRLDVADTPPRPCGFHMIAHPNPEKIARALESICAEMTPL